jgi:SAM-dependent methyltransferase
MPENHETVYRSDIQVPAGLYVSPDYCHPQRFASFGYQIQEIAALEPQRVLEVGIGNGIVSQVLRMMGKQLTTVDFDPGLRPDVTASVTDLPFAAESFDAVMCCEVLEHLPYELSERALRDLARVTRHGIVLSVPDKTRQYRIDVTLPKLGRRRRNWIRPLRKPIAHQFNGEHYWELGKKDYPVERLSASIEASGFRLLKTYRLWEHPMHRMFVAVKTAGPRPAHAEE